jgi:hypothetical protein
VQQNSFVHPGSYIKRGIAKLNQPCSCCSRIQEQALLIACFHYIEQKKFSEDNVRNKCLIWKKFIPDPARNTGDKITNNKQLSTYPTGNDEDYG